MLDTDVADAPSYLMYIGISITRYNARVPFPSLDCGYYGCFVNGEVTALSLCPTFNSNAGIHLN